MIDGGRRDRRAVLVVEDSSAHAELIRRAFAEAPNFEVSVATDLAMAQEHLAGSQPDLALVDYLLPDGSGIELLPPIGERPAFPIVIMTSHGNEAVAVDAMKRGAIDYVVKSEESLPRLPEVARRVLREHQLMVESERAKQAARHRDLQYRAVFDSSTNGLVIRRMTDGSMIAVNPAMAEMLGYSREEFLELQTEDYVHPEHLEQWQQAMAAVRAGQTQAFEARNVRRDSTVAEIESHLVPFLYEGEEQILGVVRDTSAQKAAERQREQALEEVVRLRDELERERDYLREEVKVAWRHGQIVGESSALRHVMERIDAVARTTATVLIQGESGVGKELVARAIHEQSLRSDQTMVKVNCASIPRELFESEFFGHVRGAFTGAHRDRAGRFELATRGTIFLDEVGEIPPELQVKLLRVIQEREYERVGEGRTRKADVRILVATNRDLKSLVEAGQFREDLYYRLTVFPIEVPPLRDRLSDVLPLARHFLSLAAREFERPDLVLTKYQGDTLMAYDWPGNVRELRNVIERAVLLSRGARLRLDLALPESQAKPNSSRPASSTRGGERPYLTAAEFRQEERLNLIAALEQAQWKVAGAAGAAALLGLKPSTLESRIKSLRIRKPPK